MFIEKGEVSDWRHTQTFDVSAGGTCFWSGARVEPGRMVMATLLVPPEKNLKRAADGASWGRTSDYQPVTAFARVAWCRVLAGSRLRMGLEFLDIEASHRRRMRAFLHACRLDTPCHPLYD